MQKIAKLRGVALSAAMVLAVAFPVFAADLRTACGVIEIFVNIVKYVGTIIIILSVLMLFYAAFLFLTQAGSEEGAGKARNYLIYALVGIGIGLFAQFGVPFVQNLLGSGVGIFSSGCATGLGL